MLKRITVARSDDGSMIIAMTVVMVATFAILGTLVAVQGGLNQSRNNQNRTNAFQYANAGIDQAMYRIEQNSMPTAPSGDYAPITVVGTEVQAFRDAIVSNGSRFDVEATQSPLGQNTRWTVRSTGTDPSGRKRQAIATITATPIFSDGFFADTNFELTGLQDTPIAYDSSVCPDASCALNGGVLPIPSRLGTNGSFSGATATITSFVSRWQGFNMYGAATQAIADSRCGGGDCGTAPKVAAIPTARPLPDLEPPAGVTVQSCPGGGAIGTLTIQPGHYQCNNVSVTGNVTVGNAGDGTGVVNLYVNGSFSVGAVTINAGRPTPKFRIFQRNSPGGGSICDTNGIWALLYAPGLDVNCTGSHQPVMYGAVVANYHGGTGNHFDFHWDIQSEFAVNDGEYVVKNWRECPVGVTDC